MNYPFIDADFDNLYAYSIASLHEILRKYGVSINNNATKAEIIKIIQKDKEKFKRTPPSESPTGLKTPQRSISSTIFDDSPTPVKVVSKGNTPVAINSPMTPYTPLPVERLPSPSISEMKNYDPTKASNNRFNLTKINYRLLFWIVIFLLSIIGLFIFRI
ncbi:hypothetical protein TVAG_286330 [Trichomonas vaginalis G3]|uniref:LEM domain-containing protein n=1 Tax=Trichomonas vaginalis (strain ATCC PRA-98 / G3) TaxID=412133 RepID=A2EPE7_TRIV3|nr:hypothetical protein TVAGG3_0616250 [Trichomonas vaginalis G3]EAY05455.1 hypothetical protein TVAG_286330 [Trichomonas vaginalis G3]KAI5503567.1 hypothetical protein TVAGG3_0616250 [Trichomonas vaginalis G3]|eukprot:XP_001317678.1 hypothetical protein [Trichomonas vaginalis G3]